MSTTEELQKARFLNEKLGTDKIDPRKKHLMECIQNDYKEGNEDKIIKYVARLFSKVKNLDQERVWLGNLTKLMDLGIKYETVLAGYMELRDPR